VKAALVATVYTQYRKFILGAIHKVRHAILDQF